jgi:hypothetical protein
VLVTLDEIHQNQVAELREVATTVQHAFWEGRQLAFASAGLASSVSDLANDADTPRSGNIVAGAVRSLPLPTCLRPIWTSPT